MPSIFREDILVSKHHFTPAGSPIERYSIADKPIDALVTALGAEGVSIEPQYSHKVIGYDLLFAPQ